MRKLEIGSGNRPMPGYEHLDVDPNCPDLDYCCSMEKIPVDNNTFDEIVSVHSIEHISWRKGLDALKEWYRVLAPGGRVYIACPNLKWICQKYLENSGDGWAKDLAALHPDEKKYLLVNGSYTHTLWTNFKIFSSTAGGDIHLAGYDVHLMEEYLKAAGFKSIRVISDDASLIMEAYK